MTYNVAQEDFLWDDLLVAWQTWFDTLLAEFRLFDGLPDFAGHTSIR